MASTSCIFKIRVMNRPVSLSIKNTYTSKKSIIDLFDRLIKNNWIFGTEGGCFNGEKHLVIKHPSTDCVIHVYTNKKETYTWLFDWIGCGGERLTVERKTTVKQHDVDYPAQNSRLNYTPYDERNRTCIG
jgi:hypothetical protein